MYNHWAMYFILEDKIRVMRVRINWRKLYGGLTKMHWKVVTLLQLLVTSVRVALTLVRAQVLCQNAGV